MYLHSLCLSSLHSVFVTRYTLHVLDSMFIVTLCLSSIIIYVLLSIDVLGCAGTPKVAALPCARTLDHANPRKGFRGNPARTLKVAKLPRVRSLDHTMVRVARGPQKLQLYLAFGRSTTPIHGKGCAGRRIVRKKLQLYLALAHSTTPIHCKGRAGPRKVATLPRVRSFDHANPW